MIGRYRIRYALLLGIVLMCVSSIMASAQSTNVFPKIYLPSISAPPPPFRIAFASDQDGNYDIYTMNDDGSNRTRLTNHPAWESYPVWSPDGDKIVFLSDKEHGYCVMNADGSNQRALGSWPAWSPDGSKIAVVSKEDVPDTTDPRYWIYVMDADGGDETLLAQGKWPAWSPDGSRIAFVFEDNIYMVNADGSNQTQLTAGLGSAGIPAWSPDGSRIAFRSGGNIWVMNADGSNQTQLTDDPKSDCCPLWSPNGSKILFSRYVYKPPPYGATGLFIGTINPDGSEQFTTLGYGEEWSPDGSKILFECGGRMSGVFCVTNADGSGRIWLHVPDAGPNHSSTWSPDGKKIAFVSGGLWDGGDAEIYVMNADGSNPTELTSNEANDVGPAWSPFRKP